MLHLAIAATLSLLPAAGVQYRPAGEAIARVRQVTAVHDDFIESKASAAMHEDEATIRAAVPQAKRPWIQRVALGLGLGTMGVLAQPTNPAVAAPYVPPQQPSAVKKQPQSGSAALPTVVLMGGFAYYSWSTARREDEEEEVRIKEETEKMERLSKEFTDIDESVTVDEDLMASLKKRMGNGTDTKEGGEDGPGGGGGGGGDGFTPPSDMDSGGGAAVLEPPESSPAPAEDAAASAADIERLNKLFGMGDAEK